MAVPHPDDELERLRRQCQQGLLPVMIVTGTNDFHRQQAIELLLAAVPAKAELRILDAVDDRGARSSDAAGEDEESAEVEEEAELADSLADVPELAELRGGGLFARTSFLCVRRASKWWQRCAVVLAQFAPQIAKGCGLLLEASKLDRRRKAASQMLQSLGPAVFEFRELWATKFGTEDLRGGELVKWVQRQAQALRVPLAEEAAVLLVLEVGRSLAELQAELQRLAVAYAAAPPARPLAAADLRGKLNCSFESSPFELVEAVLAHDRVRALRSVRAMCSRGVRNKSGKRETGGVFPFTVSMLFQNLAKLLEGRRLLQGGQRLPDIVAKLAPGPFGKRFAAQLQQNDRASLRHGLLALHHLQRLQRSTSESDELLLERFLGHWFDRLPVPADEEWET